MAAHAARGRATAALLACALLIGCAGTGGGGAGGGGLNAALSKSRFNGLYQGRQFPSLTNSASACRSRAREIWFEVEDGTIEMRNSRHRRNKRKLGLVGTVSADGSVAMRQADGSRIVVGRIENDRLAAATVQDAQDVQVVQGGGKIPCAYRYEAARTGSSGGGRGGDIAAAAPPVEGFPQP